MIKRIVAGLVTTALTGVGVGMVVHDDDSKQNVRIERSYSLDCKGKRANCEDACLTAIGSMGIPGAIVTSSYNKYSKKMKCKAILPDNVYNNVMLAEVKVRKLTS